MGFHVEGRIEGTEARAGDNRAWASPNGAVHGVGTVRGALDSTAYYVLYASPHAKRVGCASPLPPPSPPPHPPNPTPLPGKHQGSTITALPRDSLPSCKYRHTRIRDSLMPKSVFSRFTRTHPAPPHYFPASVVRCYPTSDITPRPHPPECVGEVRPRLRHERRQLRHQHRVLICVGILVLRENTL